MEQFDLFECCLEEWREIPGLKGYEASNFGRIRSRWTNTSRGYGNGSGSGPRKIGAKYKIMSVHCDNDGYQITSATNEKGEHKSYKVHRLVALAFLPNPNNLPMVNHKDENPANNVVDNLEWCDAKYNINYGSCIIRRSEKLMRKVSRYDKEGNYLDTFCSISEAKRKTGIRHIIDCCQQRRPYAGGFIWKYEEERRLT